jgi:iron complex transport system substrate-binding protein
MRKDRQTHGRFASFVCLAFLAAAMVCTVGCGRARVPAPTDDGTPRLVSLAPNLTEIICAVGGASNLVGRTSACDYPPAVVAHVPVIGGFGAPSVDLLLSVKPTLILDVDLEDARTADILLRLGVRRERIACGRLDEIPPAVRRVGVLVGHVTEADTLAERIAQQIRTWREANGRSPGAKPSVFAEIWNDPVMTVGRRSYVSELIALAGGRNIGDDLDKDYFPVASEWVVARDPEIIFCFYMAPGGDVREQVARRAGWSDVRAVRQGRIYGDLDNNTILRPGPRVVEGIAALRERIKPK